MNQKSRQTATTSVETDFYKLLNNSNFGIDCRNNIDNCALEPIYDDFSEIAYVKYYTKIFTDDTLRDFFSPPILKQEINQTYDAKIFALNKGDPYYIYFERKREEDLDALNTKKKKKKSTKGNFSLLKKR